MSQHLRELIPIVNERAFASDGRHILGIGDWGIRGIQASIGKLAIYTAPGGIDPATPTRSA